MAYVIQFRSAGFDVSSEPANPINPIFGHSLLIWLGVHLAAAGIETPEPDYEDWGWYYDVPAFDATYLVGASAELDEGARDDALDWTLQIEKHRSVLDRFRGRNKIQTDDPLCREIERVIRSEASVQGIETCLSP